MGARAGVSDATGKIADAGVDVDKPVRRRSVCPHDCPSTCALDVEVLDQRTIGKVYGAKDQSYTQGVICAKVARYRERVHHPDRLLQPLQRKPGTTATHDATQSDFEPIGWDEALDVIAGRFTRIVESAGAEAIWPFHFAGTMGLVQRDGLDRFRHALGTSRQHSTYCTSLPDAGWLAGAGVKRGSDARLMHQSKLIVVWGGNPVSTQVNVMHHVARARRQNGARLVVIDPYETITAKKADRHLMLRPGTDGALACAVMHVLFAEGFVDRDYLVRQTNCTPAFERHLATRTPAWAASVTGLGVEEIVGFAREYGATKHSFLRLGYGFARSRNGAVNMHAASCLPALTGAWQVPGGGALYGNGSIYTLDRTEIRGLDIPHDRTRVFDQSRIGQILCGNPADLQGGPPVSALFVQNTNPAVVAPESLRVRAGLERPDLFTVVHEQFFTDTARHADIILPATMFLEHDDIYTASGHTQLQIGRQLIDPPGDCRSNHEVMRDLAARLGLQHPGFDRDAWSLIERMLSASGLPDAHTVHAQGGIDLAPDFETANFLDGFGHADGRFHLSPDWSARGPDAEGMPVFPDHWPVIDAADDTHPFRLVAAPARQFLNTTFAETDQSRRREGEPRALMHPLDLEDTELADGSMVILSNRLGAVNIRACAFDGVQRGTVVVESLWLNADFAGGIGINALISAEAGKPDGGAVYHDTAIRVSRTVTSADLNSTALNSADLNSAQETDQ